LNLPAGQKMVLITTGGVPADYPFIAKLKEQPHISFIIAGSNPQGQTCGNVRLLADHSDFFHPDLVRAADAVVGKAGYSTIAEVYRAGVPFGYVARSDFPESPPLVDFIHREIPGFEIKQADFQEGTWTHRLADLLGLPHRQRPTENGARQIGTFIAELL
jgi:hypothetical protein